MPVLANVITGRGWGSWLALAFMLPQIAGIFSPLLFGAKADQKYAAEKVLATVLAAGSVVMAAAFWVLGHAENPAWFLALMMLNSLISAPAWSLVSTIALNNLNKKGSNFGILRVWGTLGWMMASWLVSALALDQSANVGLLGAVFRLLAAGAALFLPHTPPKGVSGGTWRSALGLDSLVLLREKDQAVYFASCFLFAIPVSAFYMHTPIQLSALGLDDVALGMSVGQMLEMGAMLGMGLVMGRMRVKWILTLAMLGGTVRFILYAVGARTGSVAWVLAGVALHGVCFPFFFEAGRVFVDRRTPVGMKAQAQALLGFVTGGIGGLTGTLVVGALYETLVVSGHGSWESYWLCLMVLSAGAMIFFFTFYKGLPAPAEDEKSGNADAQ